MKKGVSTMGRTNDKSVKEAFEQMLQVYKMKRRFDETSLLNAWPDIMGKAVANRTSQLYIRDKKLYIKLDSSVLRNELIMVRSQILEKMNDRAGSQVLEDVIFI